MADARRIVMPGGSGFLGTNLAARLVARGDEVTILSRGPASSHDGVRRVTWTGTDLGPWTETLENADAIVHLSGKRVDCRPTRRNVDKLVSSRVRPVLTVGAAWAQAKGPPPVWVQLSSLAIFGEGGEALIDESTVPPESGPRQMVGVCQAWEAAFHEAAADVPRTVLLRPGIGIGGERDPATKRLVSLARMGLAGRVGSGRQWVSWISLEDFMAILIRAIDDETMRGLYHVTSPNPVRNAEMMTAYRNSVGRTVGLPSPRLITRIGAWLLGSDPALALTGRRCVPSRLVAEGYDFVADDFNRAVDRAVSQLRR